MKHETFQPHPVRTPSACPFKQNPNSLLRCVSETCPERDHMNRPGDRRRTRPHSVSLADLHSLGLTAPFTTKTGKETTTIMPENLTEEIWINEVVSVEHGAHLLLNAVFFNPNDAEAHCFALDNPDTSVRRVKFVRTPESETSPDAP